MSATLEVIADNARSIDDALAPPAAWAPRDCRRLAVLLAVVGFAYAFFFAGRGDNQTAHFNTTRAIVERGSFEITGYPPTGDSAVVDGRVYSNKPPGMPLWGAVLHAPLWRLDRAAGWSKRGDDILLHHQYAQALWCSALPGVLTVGVMYVLFRRQGATGREAMLWSGVFAYGTLLFPYAGMLMVHNINALCVIGPWALVTSPRPGWRKDALAGALLGYSVTTNYLMAPVIPMFMLLVLWERRRWQPLIWMAIGPVVAAGLMMWFHAANFGHPFATSNSFQSSEYTDAGLLFGMFDWPDPRRAIWLTVHPMRGLFFACPVILMGLLGLFYARGVAPYPRVLAAAATVLYFFVANMSFNGWTGGWCVGPRYLIPALPLLFLFAPLALTRHVFVGAMLAAVSIANMLAVAAVRVMAPGPNSGPPLPLHNSFANPIGECFRQLTFNEVARTTGSFNLGTLAGVDGVPSFLPVALLIATFFAVLLWRQRTEQQQRGLPLTSN